MVTLDSGNVLLKPTQRRQIMSWLRRATKLGQRVGRFALNITMHRAGKFYEIRAKARDAAGETTVRCKRHDWREAMRLLVRQVTQWLHQQQLKPASIAV